MEGSFDMDDSDRPSNDDVVKISFYLAKKSSLGLWIFTNEPLNFWKNMCAVHDFSKKSRDNHMEPRAKRIFTNEN
jgi:hypothetical protein